MVVVPTVAGVKETLATPPVVAPWEEMLAVDGVTLKVTTVPSRTGLPLLSLTVAWAFNAPPLLVTAKVMLVGAGTESGLPGSATAGSALVVSLPQAVRPTASNSSNMQVNSFLIVSSAKVFKPPENR